jgi:hypothetical protein
MPAWRILLYLERQILDELIRVVRAFFIATIRALCSDARASRII